MAGARINVKRGGMAEEAEHASLGDRLASAPRVNLGVNELSAIKNNLGPQTWKALKAKLLEDDYLCEDGHAYLNGDLAGSDDGTSVLDVESIKKLMPLMYCRRLRSSVLKGIANHTRNPDVLAYLSDLDSTYLPVYDNHELRKAVARNQSSPFELLARYAEQTADTELKDLAAEFLILRK